jgi:hypothetical protein
MWQACSKCDVLILQAKATMKKKTAKPIEKIRASRILEKITKN